MPKILPALSLPHLKERTEVMSGALGDLIIKYAAEADVR